MRVYNCYVTDSRLNLTKASPLYPSGYAPSGSSLASALRLIKFIKFRPMPRRPLDIVSLLDHGEKGKMPGHRYFVSLTRSRHSGTRV